MKPFTRISSGIFALIALVHLVRLFVGVEIVIHGVTVPQWVSIPGFVIAAGLSVMLWKEARQ
ncbi:MAG TPA: hypothetical protein VFR01_01285 [Geobacterales bacterium]|nr:hypothetical protein [Geobacterales bacterium]